MASWKDELIEAAKSKSEREAEEQERHRKRVLEALTTAESAINLGAEALRFTRDRLRDKGQEVELSEATDAYKLKLRDFTLSVELVRDAAIIRVTFGDGKPREFDFAKDRHIAPADVEEYIGRRAVEVVRAAQKSTPW
ncbi:hypothetical protein [Polyangium aurulentum]|uniref:hypothetical protein n=1 Tax=Polyangium aurulentum TaxID=2567896 RepID=UPI0010AE19D6|nr:hypothetical protein [Polyangium aurulentum]UQA62672.1 hypothetical protein E8A73_020340 [Polyangium aurulentum]